MDPLIFAYEWGAEWLNNHKLSVSNGRADKQAYEQLRNDNEKFRMVESFPEISSGVKFMPISEIPAGRKYCYNIPIKNVDSYFYPKFSAGFKISERVLQDIAEKRAIVVLDYCFEGHLNDPRSRRKFRFDDTVSKLQIPKDRVLFLHGDYNTVDYQYSPYCTYEPVDIFPSWNHYDGPIMSYTPKKLCLTHNRMLGGRIHRILLLAHMFKNDIISKSYASIGHGFTRSDFPFIRHYDNTIDYESLEKVLKAQHSSPDSKNLDNNFATSIDEDSYKTSFVSVVSETLFNDNMDFFSEKIYKPLSVGHPFIINGTPRGLKRLRNMGFKTFNKWWDESYDNLDYFVDRVRAIINILNDLSKLTPEQLVDYRSQMAPVLEHNYYRFKEIRESIHKVGDSAIPIIKRYLHER